MSNDDQRLDQLLTLLSCPHSDADYSSAVDELRSAGPKILPMLVEKLSDSDSEIRCSGTEALLSIDKENGLNLVRALFHDPDRVVSQGKTLRTARWMIRDAPKLMAESSLEEGRTLPKPNPRAKDKKAERIEPVYLGIHVPQHPEHKFRKGRSKKVRTV